MSILWNPEDIYEGQGNYSHELVILKVAYILSCIAKFYLLCVIYP